MLPAAGAQVRNYETPFRFYSSHCYQNLLTSSSRLDLTSACLNYVANYIIQPQPVIPSIMQSQPVVPSIMQPQPVVPSIMQPQPVVPSIMRLQPVVPSIILRCHPGRSLSTRCVFLLDLETTSPDTRLEANRKLPRNALRSRRAGSRFPYRCPNCLFLNSDPAPTESTRCLSILCGTLVSAWAYWCTFYSFGFAKNSNISYSGLSQFLPYQV